MPNTPVKSTNNSKKPNEKNDWKVFIAPTTKNTPNLNKMITNTKLLRNVIKEHNSLTNQNFPTLINLFNKNYLGQPGADRLRWVKYSNYLKTRNNKTNSQLTISEIDTLFTWISAIMRTLLQAERKRDYIFIPITNRREGVRSKISNKTRPIVSKTHFNPNTKRDINKILNKVNAKLSQLKTKTK